MGNKKKFDKIEKNETYYAAYGEDETEKVKKPKKERKGFFAVRPSDVPAEDRLSSRFTYTREKRRIDDEEKNERREEKNSAEAEIAPKAPFVFALVVLCMVLVANLIVSSKLFSSLDVNKAAYIKIALFAVVYIVPSAVYLLMPHSGRSLHNIRLFSASVMPFAASCLGLVFCLTALQKYIIAYVFSYSEAASSVPGNIWLSLLAGAVLPAVCEELFVRGIFQYEVSKYAGGFCGIMAGALVFALLHFELQYFLVYIVAGIVLGAVTHVSRSVLPAMLVHLLNNTISILFSDKLSFVATERIGGMLLIIVLASFCFGFLILTFHIAEKISEKRAEKYLSSETEYKEKATFFLGSDEGKTMTKMFKSLASPPMLIAYAVFIIAVFLEI